MGPLRMESANSMLVSQLRAIVGARNVLTDPRQTAPYRTGFRFGSGAVLAVVRPTTLLEMWHALNACVAADTIIIMQAANTSLTGGSTPDGDDYDREVVIVNPMAISGVHVIDSGRQVICLPGTTLYQLEAALEPYGREPHSVIGSSCIGASVIGGICNSSGGALVQRGPAYTEMALFAQLGEDGELRLVNHLGIKLAGEPEQALASIEHRAFTENDIEYDPGRRASNWDYVERVRQIDSDVPARFNADPRGLFEASGCAGKVAVLAVRLDTFPKEERAQVFYVGTNDPDELTTIRRHILSQFESLPIAGEYMHAHAFDIAETYGKDIFLAIRYLGTQRLPRLFALKARLDAVARRLWGGSEGFSDRLLQRLSRLFPSHLPRRMKDYRTRFEHHLLIKMSGPGIEEAAAYLATVFPSVSGDFFQCTEAEGASAFLHRFAAAGAAVRYRSMHPDKVEGIVALDIALRRNDREWCEALPDEVSKDVVDALYYGHFFCHVFHQDYLVRKGCDPLTLEHRMWTLLDQRGAEYPAEHNVGHLYKAKPALADFYRSLDPTNVFNPGIGHTSKNARWH